MSPILDNFEYKFIRKRMLNNHRKLSLAAAALITFFTLLLLIRIAGNNDYIPHFFSSDNSATTNKPDDVPGLQINPDKLAAIVETRPLHNLVPILLHFGSVLRPDWPIHIFTTEKVNVEMLSKSLPFRHGVESGRFRVRALPESVALTSHASISRFLTGSWLWEAMAPAKKVLLFQADSILCSNSPQNVDDFLKYDFVGAPIDSDRGLGMGWNGGLSIRNREMCLDIVNTRSWETERHGDHEHGNVDYEDQWFAKAMRELPDRPDGTPGAVLPTKEVAMSFAVETIWYDQPLGFHQATVWQPGRLDEIYQWCPEYKMATVTTFTDHNTEG